MLHVLNQARRANGCSIRYQVVCVIYTTDVGIHWLILVNRRNLAINLRIYKAQRHESRLGTGCSVSRVSARQDKSIIVL